MNNADKFLEKYGMSPDGIEIHGCAMAFADEMEAGLRGEKSSLLMIPAYVTNQGQLPKNKPAIAIDAGGTNFRVAMVNFEENENTAKKVGQWPMPGTIGEITKAQFIASVADRLEPVIDESDSIGFCFSYPAEILPSHDARVLYFDKEVKIKGSEGMLLCAELEAELEKRGHGGKKYAVVNDTVATLLGSVTERVAEFDGVMGFILGTGANTCYVEKTANIAKIGGGAGSMIVNIEAAGFDRFTLGEFERRYDQASAIPGDHLFEKSVSGVYQSAVIFLTVLQGAADGLFSAKMAERLESCQGFTGPEVDEFTRSPFRSGKLAELCGTDNDREALYTLIDRSFERSARLVTANLAGVMEKCGWGKSVLHPCKIAAEGSTFEKSFLFRPKLDYYVRSYINDRAGLHCRFVSGTDVNFIGAAAAVLINK